MKKNSIKLHQCKTCEQLFYAPRGRTTGLCSDICRNIARNNQQILSRQKNSKTKKCKVCQKQFEPSIHNKKYCCCTCRIVGTRALNLAKKERYKRIIPDLYYKEKKYIKPIDWASKKEFEIEKKYWS